MGCDGGTIPKRNEIVKNKQKDKPSDKNVDRSAIWQFCSLSGLPLKKPIVACQLGRLYNKTAIIEYLLEQRSASDAAQQSAVSHIKSLKDVKELKLKEKANFDKAHQAASGSEQFQAQFVCPISGLDMNGTYKFYYSYTCGCVLSERAIKEVPNEDLCIVCSKPHTNSIDLIVLNGSREEVSELRERIKHRRRDKPRKDSSRKLKSSSETITSSTPSPSVKARSSSDRRTDRSPEQKRLKSEKVK